LGSKGIAQKSLEIDPELAETYGLLGFIKASYDWDWRRGDRIYLPFSQNYQHGMSLLASTDIDPQRLLSVIEQQVPAVNSGVQAFFSRTLEQHTAFAMLPAKLAAVMASIMGFLTLILAAVGIYGAIGFSVAVRTREIGSRIALGAKSANVIFAELRTGLILIGAGLALGTAGAVAVGRAAAALLYGISPTDPLTFAAAAGILCAIALTAVLLPAWRATRIDPAVALRA
jgi:putative ABC transport system permease protein